MLRSFRVENYRSFQAADVELRPLTLLLGKNSSGKSSLTRFIPLLRQSLNRMTSSPVLWAADDVDFGDVGNVVHHDNPSGTINISLRADPALLYTTLRARLFGWPSNTTPSLPKSVQYTARLGSDAGKTSYKSAKIEIDDDLVEIEFGHRIVKSLSINGRVVEDQNVDEAIFADTTNLFPAIERRSRSARAVRTIQRYQQTHPSVTRSIDYFFSKRTSASRRDYVRRSLHYVPSAAMAHYISGFDGILKSKLEDYSKLKELSESLLMQDYSKIVGYFDTVVRSAIEGSSYLGPSRASGARYYRLQELSVDRIDFRGENLPMYLSSLSAEEMDRLNDMLMDAFGINVRVQRITGHLSIEIGQGEYYENLADVGFGYSQILPIVAQIHASTERAPGFLAQKFGHQRRPYTAMAIEQPELHLHPAMQSSLGDLFAASVRESEFGRRGLHLLVETHSESLVGRLCALVALGQLDPDNIIIYIVNKDDGTKTSSVQTATILKDGTIKDWPIGFFTAPI